MLSSARSKKRFSTTYEKCEKESSKKVKQSVKDVKDEEEEVLEDFLFGSYTGVFEKQKPVEIINDDNDSTDNVDDNQTEGLDQLLSFAISKTPGEEFQVDEENTEDDIQEEDELIITGITQKESHSAWHDLDDLETRVDVHKQKSLRKLKESKTDEVLDGTIFQERLKNQFEKIIPAPAWADIRTAEDDDDDDEDKEDLTKISGKIVNKGSSLEKGLINISRCRDLNHSQPSNGTITSLEFHPSAKVAFTSSLNKKLNIFQVDGDDNKKLQSIHLQGFPIHTAHFTPSGEKIILSSRRKYYYSYDLIGGKIERIPEIRGCKDKSLEKFVISPDGKIFAFLGNSGYIHLVSSGSHQWMSSMKINGAVSCATFSPDSSKLFSAGKDGEVYIWDVKSQRCLHRFIDDGSISTTNLSISPNGKYLACGSSSGVVNVYDDAMYSKKSPSPLKVLLNLTTKIHGLKFNPTSEILTYYSPQKRNAMKMVHFPSLTTFSNWPVERQTLGNVSCADFSPLSGYFGVGNENGHALLFRLNHFPDS